MLIYEPSPARTPRAVRFPIRLDAMRAAFGRLVSAHFGWTAVLLACGGAALVIAYWALLADAGAKISLLALLAVLLASTLSSIAGFAFSAICGAMLLHLMSGPVLIVEVMLVCSIAVQSLSVAVLWRDIDWRGVSVFLAGGVVGLPAGVYLLTHLPERGFQLAIGALVTAYAAYMLLRRPVTLRCEARSIDACVGFLGGITGGLAAFPGAPVTIWCGTKGWDKRRQRGIYQPFILVMQIVALALILIMHGNDSAGGALSAGVLAFVPAALLGTWFGICLFNRLSDRHFGLTVNTLLLVSGLALLG